MNPNSLGMYVLRQHHQAPPQSTSMLICRPLRILATRACPHLHLSQCAATFDPVHHIISTSSAPIVTAIHLHKQEKVLEIKFSSGEVFRFSAELLRIASPSADNKALIRSELKVPSGRRHVGIMKVEPVGSYAVRIIFDDLHQAGIYTWEHLHELGLKRWQRKREYLQLLQEQGLSRDPARDSKSTGRGRYKQDG